MFGTLGFPEIILIMILALLIFGPKRLPEIGRTIGKGVAQFRRASTDLRRTIESEIQNLEEPERPAPREAVARRPPGPPAAAAPQVPPAPVAPPVEPEA
ncbi:MAG: twin-arginine translocase TatA/TatE family subunit [Thermoanaerobaculia bacterium]